MIALIAAVLAALGALAVLLARRWPRGACLAGVIALCAATAAGVLAPLEGPVAMGDAYLVDTRLIRLWLSALTGSLALLVLVTLLVAPAAGPPLLACVVVAVTALSLASSEPGAALILAASCGIMALAGAGSSWRGIFRQAAVVPAAAGAAVFLAPLTATSGETAMSPEVIPAILLAGAITLRLGVVPFHLLPLRAARTSPLSMLPLISVWAPFLFGLLAVAWATTGPVAEILQTSSARDVLAVAGGLTVVLAALAMLVQDDLGALMGVHAIGDGALVLLALASGAPALPALVLWLLVSGLARTALAAWAVATSSRMGGRRIGETRGWIRRAPLLLPGLMIPLAAGIGWPGSPPFEARWLIVEGALPGTAALLVAGASMVHAAGYIRLVWAGVRAADESSAGPVTPRRGVTHWGAAGLVLALGALALLVTAGFGVEGFTSAAAAASDWRPFEPR